MQSNALAPKKEHIVSYDGNCRVPASPTVSPTCGSFSPGKDVVFGLTPPRQTVEFAGLKVGVFGPEHYPLKEYFPPGAYLREIFMPAGHFVCGEKHLTEHANVIMKGRVLVSIDGVIKEYTAPCTFISKPGIAKRLLVIEDCVWMTIHPNPDNVRDIGTLQSMLVEPSKEPIDPVKELEQMKRYVRKEITQ